MNYRSVFTSALLFLNITVYPIEDKDLSPKDSTNTDKSNYENFSSTISNYSEHSNKFSHDFCDFILDTAPQEINDLIFIIRNPFCPPQAKPKRLLLYGPSGSGKTTLAQVIARALGKSYVLINAGLLGNEYVNSTASNLKRAIEPYLHTPCVIIIDEIDCIVKQSKNEKDPEQRTPKQIWEIFDICAQHENIFLIGITNEVNGMPEPLQTRFTGDTIEIPLNTSQDIRKKTILFHLKDTIHECSDSYFNSLAKKAKSLSNRELERMVQIAIAESYLRDWPNRVTPEDFDEALQKIQRSRSILKQWSWSDYEKPLQITLQVASLFVNIASLIMTTKNAWDSYRLQEKGINQSAKQAEVALKSSEKIAIDSLKMQDAGMKQTKAIADRADQRTVDAHKFQKISLGAADQVALWRRNLEKESPYTPKCDQVCQAAFQFYEESYNELAKLVPQKAKNA